MTTDKKKVNKKKAPTDRAVEPAPTRKPLWKPVVDWLMGVMRTIWSWSWAVSIFVAAFLGLSLATYHPGDPSYFVSTSAAPKNFCALAGSWTSAAMYEAFGMSAWWFVLGIGMIIIFAVRAMWRGYHGETDPRRLNPPKFSSAFGFVALLIGSTCLEALRLRRFDFQLPNEPGGILGATLASGIEPYIGVGLSTAVFFALIAIGLSLLMDFEWADVCEAVGRFIYRWFIAPVFRLVEYFRQSKQERLLNDEEPVEKRLPEVTDERLPIVTHDAGSVDVYEHEESEETTLQKTLPQKGKTKKTVKKDAPVPVVLGMNLLDDPDTTPHETDMASLEMTSRLIVSKLKSYRVEAAVRGVRTGPVITQYWLEPGPGVKGQEIDKVREDLRRADRKSVV